MTKTNWKEIYNDLPTHVAEALRAARIKPEQIVTKEDGELMAIEGIKEEDVNTIRAIYNSETAEGAKKTEVAPVIPTDLPAVAGVEGSQTTEEVKPKKVIAPRKRGKKYRLMSKEVKKGELYSIEDAVEKLSKLAGSTKLKTVELTLNTHDTGLRGELKLSHSTGKEIKIAIFSDKVASDIEKGKIDFSILLATPADMPKLARLAKILGPKGLMPNPKSGTVTENPEKRAAELTSGGTLPFKTEAKFPIIHLSLGKITQDKKDLAENSRSHPRYWCHQNQIRLSLLHSYTKHQTRLQ